MMIDDLGIETELQLQSSWIAQLSLAKSTNTYITNTNSC